MNRRYNNNRRRPSGGQNQRFSQSRGQKRGMVSTIHASQLTQKAVAVQEEVAYVAHHEFKDFPLTNQLQQNIKVKGYTSPTAIQDEAISHILNGRDIIGIANTGTGKTAAFLIPLVNKVFKDRSEKVLIVAPTRELAVQILDEFRAFAQGMGMHATLCIGGTNMGRQRADLKMKPNFIIGTPGRLKDLINQRGINLQEFHTVVLDEADLMVDIGFIHDIKFFIGLLPHDRQSLFFSATISGKVKEIMEQFVHNPVSVSVKQQETSENVEQSVIKVDSQNKKIDQLHDLLIKDEFSKVLIFGRTKWSVQKLSNELVRRGFRADAIHGNKKQNQRQRTLDRFKKNEINILLATDVASRGLDIDNVSHVINYDMPASYEDYVHRIGRTGRANKRGIALTFVD